MIGEKVFPPSNESVSVRNVIGDREGGDGYANKSHRGVLSSHRFCLRNKERQREADRPNEESNVAVGRRNECKGF